MRQPGKPQSAGRTTKPALASSSMARAGANAAASESRTRPMGPQRQAPYGYDTPPMTPPKVTSYFAQASSQPRQAPTPPATPPQARRNPDGGSPQLTYGHITSGMPYSVPNYNPPQSAHGNIVSDFTYKAPTQPHFSPQPQAYQPAAYNPRNKTAGSTSSRPGSSSSMRSFWNTCKETYHNAPPGEGEVAMQYYREWRAKRAVKKAQAAAADASQPIDIPGLSRKERKGSFTGSLSSSLHSMESRFGMGKGNMSFDGYMAGRHQKKTAAKKAQISVPILRPEGTGSVMEGAVYEGEYPITAIAKTSTDDFGKQILMDKRQPEWKNVASWKPLVVEKKDPARVTRWADFMVTPSKLTAALKRKDSDESFYCVGQVPEADDFLERCLKCGKEDKRYMRKGLCKECQ